MCRTMWNHKSAKCWDSQNYDKNFWGWTSTTSTLKIAMIRSKVVVPRWMVKKINPTTILKAVVLWIWMVKSNSQAWCRFNTPDLPPLQDYVHHHLQLQVGNTRAMGRPVPRVSHGYSEPCSYKMMLATLTQPCAAITSRSQWHHVLLDLFTNDRGLCSRLWHCRASLACSIYRLKHVPMTTHAQQQFAWT